MQAVLEGISFKQLVNRALEREINPSSFINLPATGEWQAPVSPHPLNDKNLSWDQLRAIVDEEMDTHLQHKLTDEPADA